MTCENLLLCFEIAHSLEFIFLKLSVLGLGM